MKRRQFLTGTGLVAGASLLPRPARSLRLPAVFCDAKAGLPEPQIAFETSDPQRQGTYQKALAILAGNVTVLPHYAKQVLIEGSTYRGIWLEDAPQEGLIYSLVHPGAGRTNHMAFFDLQHPDGQIPCAIKTTSVEFSQIQMVAPIAATAWELSQQTGDSELLDKAYASCSRWEGWLRRYRDTRRTGLCEGFCTYDTGQDNSPRWRGIPNQCPDKDARKCPPLPSLPRLCPDLSATVYSGRIALAAMARALGKNSEADRWLAEAHSVQSAILKLLYSPADAAFFDLDAQNHFVRVIGDATTRVLGEHVVDQKLFETIYQRQMHNPKAFWAPYPFPSIALDDPSFVRPIPRNSWGGASQALTALRAPRWMEHYGKPADLAHLMEQWVAAIVRQPQFRQQMDPLTGVFTVDRGDYSPCALVLMDFTWRLAGVRQAGDELEWNVRPPTPAEKASFRLRIRNGRTAELNYAAGRAELTLHGKRICSTGEVVRLVTDLEGKLRRAVGIGAQASEVRVEHAAGVKHGFTIAPNESLELDGARS